MTDSPVPDCPTWCSGHDADEDPPAARQHYAEIAEIGLVDLAETLGTRNNCARPVRISLSSWHQEPSWNQEPSPASIPALIELEVPGGTAGFMRSCEWLTADEARAIAHALLTAADLAEHPEPGQLVPEQTNPGPKVTVAGPAHRA